MSQVLKVIEHRIESPGAEHISTFNMTSGKSISLLNLSKLIAKRAKHSYGIDSNIIANLDECCGTLSYPNKKLKYAICNLDHNLNHDIDCLLGYYFKGQSNVDFV